MSSSRPSPPEVRCQVTRLLAALCATVLLVTGCGAGAEELEQPERPVAPGGDPDIEEDEPDSGEPLSTQDLLEGRLAFLDADADHVRRAIEPYDGVVELEVPEIGAVQVAFPVTTRRELLDIRDELREDGHQVDVVLVTDPDLEEPAGGGPALDP